MISIRGQCCSECLGHPVIGPILDPSEGQEERKEMDDVEVDEATTDQDTLNKVSKHVKHVMFPKKKRVWKFEMFLEKSSDTVQILNRRQASRPLEIHVSHV